MKKVISILLCVGIIFSLCACSVTQSDNDFVAGVYGTVSSFDPIYAESDVEKIIAHNCFEGLLRFDETGNICLAGATAYTIDNDGIVYTFRLNPNACWNITSACEKIIKKKNISIEKSITAEDYAYGIERLMSSDKKELENIKSVKAIDKLTLEITLKKADYDFLYKLAALPVFPCNKAFCESVEDYGSNYEEMLYNGPYYVKRSDTTETVIEKNEIYNGNVQVQNKKVLLYTTGTQENMLRRFKDGKYNVLVADSNTVIKGTNANATCNNAVWGIAFNCNTEEGTIKELRELLLSAIDIKGIELPYYATAKANCIVPENFISGDKKYNEYAHEGISYEKNIENANMQLETVLKSLNKNSCEISLYVPKELKTAGESIIAQWSKAFGNKIKAKLSTFEVKESEEIAKNGKYTVAILPLMPSCKTASGILSSVENAPCYYKNLNTLDGTQEQSNVAKEKVSVYSQVEKEIAQSGIFTPLFYTGTRLYYKNDTDGIYLADGGSIVYFHKGVQSDE